MQKRKGKIKRLLLTIDAFFNVLILDGSEDHSISGRVGYEALTTGKKNWLRAEKAINTLFFWDKDHCRNSIEWDEIGNYTQLELTQDKIKTQES